MPETTRTVRWATVHLPEGGLGQVKVVRDDGFKPWKTYGAFGVGLIALLSH